MCLVPGLQTLAHAVPLPLDWRALRGERASGAPALVHSVQHPRTAPLEVRRKADMATMQYHLNEDFVASDVTCWYDKARLGETAVIALPSHPSVRLYRRPNGHVYWSTDGSKGLTVSLEDASRRLAMFHT